MSVEHIRLAFDRRNLLLCLVPLLIYGLFNLVLTGVQTTEIRFETLRLVPVASENASLVAPAADTASAAGEYRIRMLWVSAFLVAVTVALAVGVNAALSVWRNTPRKDRALMFGLALGAFAVIVVAEQALTGDRWYTNLGAGLFRDLFASPESGTFLCRGPVSDSCSLIWQLNTGLDAAKYSGAFALIMLSLAFISTLNRPVGSPEAEARHLAGSAREQQNLLYQGAAVYALACLSMIAWMSWPIPYLAPDVAAEYRQVIIGAVVLQGAGFTLGVAAIFLPPSILLRHRALKMAEAETESVSSQAAWLQDFGFTGRIADRVGQVVAMLLPIAIGLFPALAEVLK